MNDNKLITEFMNGEHPLAEVTHEAHHNYRTSWDWLMPVVSKCREESNAEDGHWEAIYYSLEGCDIDVTYNAVVEFIQEYRLTPKEVV